VSYNVRDMLGHFVRPRSAEGDMCEHACCRGRRQHPKGTPKVLPSKALRHASDENLAARYSSIEGDSKKDERARAQLLHEMQRRDDAARAKDERAHAKYARQLEHAELREHAYVAAEDATRGSMVNRKGQARGVNPRTLITARAEEFERYASDELKEYFTTHHRPTAASFRGEDTRYVPRASEPRRRKRGVVSNPQWARR